MLHCNLKMVMAQLDLKIKFVAYIAMLRQIKGSPMAKMKYHWQQASYIY